jgi:hypothetical protein
MRVIEMPTNDHHEAPARLRSFRVAGYEDADQLDVDPLLTSFQPSNPS